MKDFSDGFMFFSEDSFEFRSPRKFKKSQGNLIEIIEPKDAKIPLMYIWMLFEYSGKIEPWERVKYLTPTNDLGNGLEEEWVCLNLNFTDCFQFDYTPKEGDNLKICHNVILSPYLSFIYKNNEWTIDHHSPETTNILMIKKGIIQPFDKI